MGTDTAPIRPIGTWARRIMRSSVPTSRESALGWFVKQMWEIAALSASSGDQIVL
jgi:hypothetical protein